MSPQAPRHSWGTTRASNPPMQCWCSQGSPLWSLNRDAPTGASKWNWWFESKKRGYNGKKSTRMGICYGLWEINSIVTVMNLIWSLGVAENGEFIYPHFAAGCLLGKMIINQWIEGQVPYFQTQPSCLSNGKQPLEAKKWKLSIQVFFGANYVIKPQPSTRMDMFEYSNYWFHWCPCYK